MITQARTPVRGPAANSGARRSSLRVAAIFEPSRAGVAMLAEAAALAASRPTELTVVAVVAQARGPRGCGVSPHAYNCAVRDAASEELRRGAQLLGPNAEDASFVLLLEGRDPPLHQWVRRNGFDLVLLPARRRVRRILRHPAMRRLRELTDAEVRIVPALPV